MIRLLSRRLALAGAGALSLSCGIPVGAAAPLRITTQTGRAVEVTEWLPRGRPVGQILFSHGAGSAPWFYDALLGPMVAAGWHVLAPLHVDSRLHPDFAKFPGLASWRARLEDFAALTDHIGHRPYVAVGHSYGALTALVLGGAQSVPPPGWSGPQTDGQARAVVAFSPPAAIPMLITIDGYAKLAVPALIETGTGDIVPGMAEGGEGWKVHLDAYTAAAPGGHRYGLVLEGVNHYFGGLICDPKQPGPPQVAGMGDANRIAGLFLRGFGQSDGAAQAQLDAAVTGQLPVRLLSK